MTKLVVGGYLERALAPGARVLDWSSGVDYQQGDMLRYNSLVFTCVAQHTSQASFGASLAYIAPVSKDVAIYQQANFYSMSALDPVRYDSSQSMWIVSTGTTYGTLPTGVLLYIGSGYALVAFSGAYRIPSHGKTVGNYWASSVSPYVTSTLPVSGYIKEVYTIVDSDNLIVNTYRDPTYAGAQIAGDGYALIGALSVTSGGLSIDYDATTYPNLKVLVVGYSSNTTSTAKSLAITFNNDTSTANYSTVQTLGYTSSVATSTVAGSTLMFVSSTTAGAAASFSVLTGNLAALGSYRCLIATGAWSYNTLLRTNLSAIFWKNTASTVSSIQFTNTNTPCTYDILVYGAP